MSRRRAATGAERSKAARIRAKDDPTDEQKRWLEKYVERFGRPDAAAEEDFGDADGSDWADEDVESAEHAEAAANYRGEAELPFVGDEPASPDVGRAVDDRAAPDEPADIGNSSCSIPDCPACKQHHAGAICGTTGRTVWPPMSAEGAEAMARGLLFLIGMAIRLFRADRQHVKPTEREIKDLGRGIREVSLRRANWLGRFDDLFMIAGALGGYAIRAINAPAAGALASGAS